MRARHCCGLFARSSCAGLFHRTKPLFERADELVVLLGRMLRERSLMAAEVSIHLFASAWRTYLDLFALASGTLSFLCHERAVFKAH